jgi:DNA-directed RNA polymerase subunit E'/Rpb7
MLTAAIIALTLKPEVVEGAVDHKTITGKRNSISHTIVIITDTDLIIKVEEFKEDFKNFTSIDNQLAHRLESWYDEIDYLVSVRTNDESMAYFVDREDFNRVAIGDRIRFKILRFKTSTIQITKILG